VRPADLLLVIGDGLSSYAVHRQALPLIRALLPYLHTLGISLAPVVLAHQSRVALGDDIGETLKARAVAILIGERPGSLRRIALASISPGNRIVNGWSRSVTVFRIFARRG
jgi:ethanolamine ammonia-lyase small subunit